MDHDYRVPHLFPPAQDHGELHQDIYSCSDTMFTLQALDLDSDFFLVVFFFIEMQSVQFHFNVIAQWKRENVEANDGKRKNVFCNYGSLWRSRRGLRFGPLVMAV